MKSVLDESLLTQLGQLARSEERAARGLQPELPSVEDTAERILQRLAETERWPARRLGCRERWLKFVKSWLTVPFVIAVGVSAWLLMRKSEFDHALPEYALSVIAGDSDMRAAPVVEIENSAAARPLRGGAPGVVLLRPATRALYEPEVQVWYDSGPDQSRWPARVEADALGGVRLRFSVPDKPGRLIVLLGMPGRMPGGRDDLKQDPRDRRRWILPIEPAHRPD